MRRFIEPAFGFCVDFLLNAVDELRLSESLEHKQDLFSLEFGSGSGKT